MFVAGFDDRHGVIVRRDLLTLAIDADGRVPELFEHRIENGRYEPCLQLSTELSLDEAVATPTTPGRRRQA